MAKPSLMSEASAYLAGRRDITVLATGDGTIGPRIVGVHLRRVLEKKIWNAAIFTPHEREGWRYYGQAFVVEEADFDDDGALVEKQQTLRNGLIAAGCEVILAKTLGFVKEALGEQPGNWAEYEKRVEK